MLSFSSRFLQEGGRRIVVFIAAGRSSEICFAACYSKRGPFFLAYSMHRRCSLPPPPLFPLSSLFVLLWSRKRFIFGTRQRKRAGKKEGDGEDQKQNKTKTRKHGMRLQICFRGQEKRRTERTNREGMVNVVGAPPDVFSFLLHQRILPFLCLGSPFSLSTKELPK